MKLTPFKLIPNLEYNDTISNEALLIIIGELIRLHLQKSQVI